MEQLFLTVLNMSLTASLVIVAILLARLPLKKAPKAISYALWAVAGFRLVCPFTLESVFSPLPVKSSPIPQDIAVQAVPRIDSGIAVIDNAVSASLPAAVPAASTNPLEVVLSIGTTIWLIGIAAMLIYSMISVVLFVRRLRGATRCGGNIYEADNLKTPFVIGFFRPSIYLPAGLTGEEHSYIILHEQTHIRRHDHIAKVFAYLVLCLHWFNPLVWVAFVLMGEDMEMSCDERVLCELGGGIKKAYSLSLVRMSAGHKIINGNPLAFGEGTMKERVKNVLRFQRKSRVTIAVIVVLVAVLALVLMVNRATPQPWVGVAQKTDWLAADMNFNQITFGSDRDWIAMRMGDGPDAAVFTGATALHYVFPPTVQRTDTGTEVGKESEIPGSGYDVTLYLDDPQVMEKKGFGGVYRMDLVGDGDMAAGPYNAGTGTLAGILAHYGGPDEVARSGDVYTLWYYSPEDSDRRMWFEVQDGALTMRMGIVCVCEGDGISAGDAVEQLTNRVINQDGQLLFQIPAQYYKPAAWNIHIAGRAVAEDGFGTSVHALEDENENHAWEAGKWYVIPVDTANLTELRMDITLPDEHGNPIESSIDLLTVQPVITRPVLTLYGYDDHTDNGESDDVIRHFTGILQPEADTGWTDLTDTVFIAVQVPDGTVSVQIYYAETGTEVPEHLLYSNPYAETDSPTGYTWRVSDDYPTGFLGHIWAVTTDADGAAHSSDITKARLEPTGYESQVKAGG